MKWMTEMDDVLLNGFRVLTVPGLHGSGPDHWQSRWERLYPHFERVEQARWNEPVLDVWSARLGRVLRRSSRPTLLVAHSFGCLASVHRLSAGAANVVGALLVAPAHPGKFGVADVLADARLACPSIVVGSMNDPWMEGQCAAEWAQRWGSDFINLGCLGHINAESRLGNWPAGFSLLKQLADTASSFISVSQRAPAGSQEPVIAGRDS